MKKRNIALLAILAILILLSIFIPKAVKKTGPQNPAGGGRARQTFTVRSVPAQKKDLQSYLRLNGEIDWAEKLDVFPDVSGRIESIVVEVGDWVEKGSLIARVDPSRPGDQYKLSPVYAPVAGRIVALNTSVGASISLSSPLARIAASDVMEIYARVNERDIENIAMGQRAAITVQAWGEEKFPAKLLKISPMLDSASRTLSITLGFDNIEKRISVGMFAQITLFTALHKDQVVIPAKALLKKGEENYLWIVEEDMKVSRRVVTAGARVDEEVAIRTGLSAGERVVIEGVQLLSDGATVRDVGLINE